MTRGHTLSLETVSSLEEQVFSMVGYLWTKNIWTLIYLLIAISDLSEEKLSFFINVLESPDSKIEQ